MRIGVIGLGIIGARMAVRWREAGHEVCGWNRTASHARGLGIRLLKTPADVAVNSDVVVVVVADPAALKSVVRGTQGIASVSLKGKVVIDAGTVGPKDNQDAECAVRSAGGRFLETPFTGSRDAATAGKLVFYVGGNKSLMQKMLPVLMQVGRKCFHFGPVGRGSDMKLIMNMMLAGQMQSMAEGAMLVRKCGIAWSTFVEAYRMNAGWNLLCEMKIPKLRDRDFSTHFALKHMSKDVRLAVKRIRDLGVDLPHLRHTRKMFAEAMRRGYGDSDFSVLYRSLEDRQK